MIFVALLVSWLPVTFACDGAPLLTPLDHYEVQVFEARVIGQHVDPFGSLVNDYVRSRARSVSGTSVELEPGRDEVVGWDGMWDASWTAPASPPVVAVTMAQNRSDEPCR